MPERKWYKGRPIRRTKRMPGGFVKIIFDDGPKGQPGDQVFIPENDYAARDANGQETNVKREFVTKENVEKGNTVKENVSKTEIPASL